MVEISRVYRCDGQYAVIVASQVCDPCDKTCQEYYMP